MENKLFTIVNKADEASFLQDLKQHPNNFKKKLIFVFGNSENYIVVNGEKFLPTPATNNGYEYVDLGLPSGLKWATCNVGATSPEEYGLYFAWGETTGYTTEQITSGVRAFNKDEYNAGPAASISTDLTLEQDTAHVNMGGNWRMPTQADCQELLDNCDSMWTDNYNGTGMSGYVFTSKTNGNSVFFPAAGSYSDSFNGDIGSWCRYWSTSWNTSADRWYMLMASGDTCNVSAMYGYPYCGFSVRGVFK